MRDRTEEKRESVQVTVKRGERHRLKTTTERKASSENRPQKSRPFPEVPTINISLCERICAVKMIIQFIVVLSPFGRASHLPELLLARNFMDL